MPLAVPSRRLRTSENSAAPNGSSGFVQPSKCLVPTDSEVSSGRSYKSLSPHSAQNWKRAGDATCSLSVPFLQPLFSMFLSGLSPLFYRFRAPFPVLV